MTMQVEGWVAGVQGGGAAVGRQGENSDGGREKYACSRDGGRALLSEGAGAGGEGSGGQLCLYLSKDPI